MLSLLKREGVLPVKDKMKNQTNNICLYEFNVGNHDLAIDSKKFKSFIKGDLPELSSKLIKCFKDYKATTN